MERSFPSKATIGFLVVIIIAVASAIAITFKANAEEKNKKCPYSSQWETSGLKICCDDKKPYACLTLEQYLKNLDRHIKEQQEKQDKEAKNSGLRT